MRYFKKYRPAGEWEIWFAWRPVWAWREYLIQDVDNLHEREIGLVWLEKVWRRRNPSNLSSKWSYKVI